MSNIGKRITDSYCNGFAGRRYDLCGSLIEAEGFDWIVIRNNSEPIFINFKQHNKQKLIDTWCNE